MHNKNTRHVYDYERFVHLKKRTCIASVLENGHDDSGNGGLDHVEDAIRWRSAYFLIIPEKISFPLNVSTIDY